MTLRNAPSQRVCRERVEPNQLGTARSRYGQPEGGAEVVDSGAWFTWSV
jgi:hypothetical protein